MHLRHAAADRAGRGALRRPETALAEIGAAKRLSIRVWSPDERAARPRLAICTTLRPEPPLALLRAIRDGTINAEAAVMLGNRHHCRSLAEQFGVDWHLIGDENGVADDERLIDLCDEYDVDYIILARYMRILSPSACWKYAGGRIINLHHGLLPSFPGMRPYHEAYAGRMLTYGATCHFIVPELDAGNQIIYQSTFTVPPGMKLDEIIRRGQEDNEPHCLVEGVRRVVAREVQAALPSRRSKPGISGRGSGVTEVIHSLAAAFMPLCPCADNRRRGGTAQAKSCAHMIS